MHSAFQMYEEATPELIAFLKNTVLGTNGTLYQHLDTHTRIQELENPLHLSLIRNEKILGNITFCRRGKNWYVRYFAFDKALQGTGKDTGNRKQSILKTELRQFFSEKLRSNEVNSFYAYIDAKNEKSVQLAKELGFSRKPSTVNTLTYSRFWPKSSERIRILSDEQAKEHHSNLFQNEAYFFEQKVPGRTYALYNSKNEIVASAHVKTINWKMHRLPGRFGHVTIKVLPYIPILSAFIQPKKHVFLGVDHVFVAENNKQLYEELLSAILHINEKKLLVWWTAKRPKALAENFYWGPMHKFYRNTKIDFYTLEKNESNLSNLPFLVASDLS